MSIKNTYYRYAGHTVTLLQVHIVFATKYRYKTLTGDLKLRARYIIRQICDAEDVHIISGNLSTDHIHLFLEYPPRVSVSNLIKKIKGRTSRKLQLEFPKLKQKYWGRHLWAIGYAAFAVGKIDKDTIENYINNHLTKPNKKTALKTS